MTPTSSSRPLPGRWVNPSHMRRPSWWSREVQLLSRRGPEWLPLTNDAAPKRDFVQFFVSDRPLVTNDSSHSRGFSQGLGSRANIEELCSPEKCRRTAAKTGAQKLFKVERRGCRRAPGSQASMTGHSAHRKHCTRSGNQRRSPDWYCGGQVSPGGFGTAQNLCDR
jgi:hypothetical protein